MQTYQPTIEPPVPLPKESFVSTIEQYSLARIVFTLLSLIHTYWVPSSISKSKIPRRVAFSIAVERKRSEGKEEFGMFLIKFALLHFGEI